MTRKAPRVRCPECGRLADRRKYLNGDVAYFHTYRRGPFGFLEVTDSCYIKATKAE